MKKIFLPFLLLLNTCATPVVILVHGSFAQEANWYSPGGTFFEKLEQQAHAQGHFVVPFSWTGYLGDSAKLRAAHVLCRLIISYPPTEKIILIGHSHGGNVINLASQLVHEAHNTAMLRGIEIQNTVRTHLVRDLAGSLPLTRSLSSAPHLSGHISEVYLLATPIDMKNYAPEMSVIDALYNLYSDADYIQQVLGMYKQKFPTLPRITNFRVTFDKNKKKNYAPGHWQMHDKLIAQWLLKLPEIVKAQPKSVGHNVDVCFCAGGPTISST